MMFNLFFRATLPAMKAEHTERHNALITLRLVRELASISVQPCDADAASVAILVRAIEIATPSMSADLRASLFSFRHAGVDAGCDRFAALS